jgi:formyltetrahydrofolate-dependent phosphoribosylglycinamide formyltransferase
MGVLGEFDRWAVRHVRRDQNQRADCLANKAMDAGQDVLYEESSASTGRLLRLGVLISGGGRTLANLDREIKSGRLNAVIAVVICSRSRIKGVELSRSLGYEPVNVRTKDFGDIDAFSVRLAEVLDEAETDLVIQAGWLCLWKIPQRYASRVMNIHPALLPAFGGQGMWGHNVHEAVLRAGCKISGCTVHFCTNQYDAGPIILQRWCPVLDGDDADSLAERVFEQECIAYPEAIRLYGQGRLEVRSGRVCHLADKTGIDY